MRLLQVKKATRPSLDGMTKSKLAKGVFGSRRRSNVLFFSPLTLNLTAELRSLLVPLLCTTRAYTPISNYTSVPERRFEKVLHDAEEAQTLWAEKLPVGSVEEAVRWWLRFGNNPVVHAAGLPSQAPPGTTSSPFGFIEDYVGTNLITSTESHREESTRFWVHYFERRGGTQLRLYRRTASNHLGSARAEGEGFQDEADDPQTHWEQDTFFMEMAYLSERHLKFKGRTLAALEKAIWVTPQATVGDDVKKYLDFFDAQQQQRPPGFFLPLPIPSIWFYEGERREAWAKAYISIAQEAYQFFQSTLAKCQSLRPAALGIIATQWRRINEILVARHARQEAAGIMMVGSGSSASPASSGWCESELEREQRSVEEGIFDPEDMLDDSEAWKAEHEQVMALAAAPLTLEDGTPLCTLEDFWRHAIRREAFETLHVLTDDGLRGVAAASRSLLLQEMPYKEVLEQLVLSLEKGSVDIAAAVFQPQFNTAWCKWSYAKFGASSIAQHTHVARRRLLYHYAASAEEVASTAALYFSTKPLSSRLDYASPYGFRRSLAALCGAHGVERMRVLQRPLLTSSAYLALAEDQIRDVCRAAASDFGKARRQRDAALRRRVAHHPSGIPPLTNLQLFELGSELLEGGEESKPFREPFSPASLVQRDKIVSRWPLGGRKVLTYAWEELPALLKLRELRRAGPLTTERAAGLLRLQKSVRLEVTLWRQVGAEERANQRRAEEVEAARVEALRVASPSLMELHSYAVSLYDRWQGSSAALVPGEQDREAESEVESEQWQFVALLHDCLSLDEDGVAVVDLPMIRPGDPMKTPILPGTYRLRLRGFDSGLHSPFVPLGGSGSHPGLCAEAFTPAFEVFDAVSPILQPYTESSGVSAIPRADYMSVCRALREAGVSVSLRVEFEGGQGLTPAGDCPVERFRHLLEESSLGGWRESTTEFQREIEPRCEAFWSLFHPGSTEEEWASSRYEVLQEAVKTPQRDWWASDRVLRDSVPLGPAGPVPGLADSPDPMTAVAAHRYGVELCSLLPSIGRSHPPVKAEAPQESTLSAVCEVNGRGEIRRLEWESGETSPPKRSPAVVRETSLHLEKALDLALSAVTAAQDRHAVATMMKLGPLEKELQVMSFCGADGLEMGGKYARTYCYAVEKAKQAIADSTAAGRETIGVRDEEKERVSEGEHVDRFASTTHPEQRKTRFVPRTTLSGQNIEDPTPDQESTWGR